MNNDVVLRLDRAILDAILQSSKDDTLGVPLLRTGEIIESLLSTMAYFLAISPEGTGTPARTRETIDNLAKRLRRKVMAVQDELRASSGVPTRLVDPAAIYAATNGGRSH